MTRCVRLAVALVLFTGLAAPANAQVSGFLSAGATIPTGDFGDGADAGWMGDLGVTFPVGPSGLWLGGVGSYGQNSLKNVDDYNWTLMGGSGLVGYTISPMARTSPFVFGSAGLLSAKASGPQGDSDSESGFAWGGGAGLLYGLNESAALFASGRYQSASLGGDSDNATLSFINISAGVTIRFGGATTGR